MKTLLSASPAAAFALSVLSVLPAARADPVTCTVENGGVYGLPVLGMEEGHCYELAVCQESDGSIVVGHRPYGASWLPCTPILVATPVDCATADGYTVTVILDGPTPLPVARSADACVGSAGPPPIPQMVGPCGPGGQGTGVFLPSGSQVTCVGPLPPPPGVAPCHQVGGDLLLDTRVGVAVNGGCTAVGYCLYAGSPSVGLYRDGDLQQCAPLW